MKQLITTLGCVAVVALAATRNGHSYEPPARERISEVPESTGLTEFEYVSVGVERWGRFANFSATG